MSGRKNVVVPSSPNEFRFDRAMMFRTGETVPESGIYRVTHGGHRLPHEVTLLRDQLFPRCSKCATLVEFEPVALAPTMGDRRGKIILYELPVLEAALKDRTA
jgi:hypothetical protein